MTLWTNQDELLIPSSDVSDLENGKEKTKRLLFIRKMHELRM